jgi:hypothetical protein
MGTDETIFVGLTVLFPLPKFFSVMDQVGKIRDSAIVEHGIRHGQRLRFYKPNAVATLV